MEVDANLYEFLRENETGVTKDEYGIVIYVHVPFYLLDEFVEIVGFHHFEEGGLNVLLFGDSVCVDLNEIIEGAGHEITSYKKCFDEFDLRRFAGDFKALEGEE